MSDTNDSDIMRLFFWFVWLSGFVLVVFLLGRFFYFSFVLGKLQLAVPFFLGFLWQSVVQLTALKRYQYSEGQGLREPVLIQVSGSVVLLLIVTVIVVFRN